MNAFIEQRERSLSRLIGFIQRRSEISPCPVLPHPHNLPRVIKELLSFHSSRRRSLTAKLH